MLTFSFSRELPIIRQSETSECGLACVAMIANYHGYEIDMMALRRQYQSSLKGSTLRNIIDVFDDLNLLAKAIRCEVSEISEISLPAILHWNLNHFVVLVKISHGISGVRYHIIDPARGRMILKKADILRYFTGVLLEISKNESFKPDTIRAKLKIRQLWSRISGFWPAARQILLLSVILQASFLVSPLFLQMAIDRALPSSDLDFLFALAIGFSGIAAISAFTSWVRALALVRLSTSLSYQITANLFRHLLRLPLPWFERRHIGDIISRFNSSKNISDILSQALMASVIDGVMASFTLLLMFVLSPVLATLVVVSILCIVLVRITFFSAIRYANVNMLMANAVENSTFIESVRGIATVKSFGDELNRYKFWLSRKTSATNAEIKIGYINSTFSSFERFITSIEIIMFVYFSVRFAILGSMTVGVIFAFQSYRQQFLEAATRLTQQVMSYRLADMHLARIADIALASPEKSSNHLKTGRKSTKPSPRKIELRNVWFRYAPSEPDILQNINLNILPGEMIALVGPSGGGKTTLIKILMGLLEPTYGEILIDGEPLKIFGLDRWRREIGCVFQNDSLFAGSIADNICMFSEEPNNLLIEEVAEASAIADEIKSFPMRYNTFVGDMGSVLSSGQKQRVVLARALYRKPSAVFLDEFTSNLDPRNEDIVINSISNINCTRVTIAHRESIIARCSRVFLVDQGQCLPLSTGPHVV